MIATTAEGKVLYWSKGAQETFGYTSTEAVGRRLSEIIVPPDRVDEARAIEKEALNAGLSSRATVRSSKNGSLMHVDISCKAVRDAQGGIEYLRSSTKDITSLNLTREAISAAVLFRSLLDCIPDAIVLVNSIGRIVLSNSHAEKLFGYQRVELQGKPVELLMPERFRRAHIRHQANYHTESESQTRAMGKAQGLFGLRKDGTEFPADISLSTMETKEGALVVTVIHDIEAKIRAEQLRTEIVERERAAKALAESDLRLRQLAENVREVFFLVDVQMTHMFYVNPAYESIWGRSCASLYTDPMSWADSIHPDDRERVLQEIVPQGAMVAFDTVCRIVRPDGQIRTIRAHGFPIRNDAGEVYRIAGTANDITDRDQTKEEICHLNVDLEHRVATRTAELEMANKALEMLSHTVSHDLRAPLLAIDGFTRILEEDHGTSMAPEAQRLFERVRHNTKLMAQRIEGLLAFSRTAR
jgi:PAS domain S-box-containing protein